MVWLRRKTPPVDTTVHRGRVFYSKRSGWWRYACRDCNYGAGSRADQSYVWPWLMQCANDHADPDHWSRRRGQ